jgi:hypothetical protein
MDGTGRFILTISLIIKQMSNFIMVLFVMLISFSAARYHLFHTVDYTGGISDPSQEFVSNSDPWMSLLSTFNMGVLGDFDSSTLYGGIASGSNPHIWFQQVVFVACATLVSIVMLNLLIALMGTSYEKAMEDAKPGLLYEQACILIEFESVMTKQERENPEWFPEWIHVLRPVQTELDESGPDFQSTDVVNTVKLDRAKLTDDGNFSQQTQKRIINSVVALRGTIINSAANESKLSDIGRETKQRIWGTDIALDPESTPKKRVVEVRELRAVQRALQTNKTSADILEKSSLEKLVGKKGWIMDASKLDKTVKIQFDDLQSEQFTLPNDALSLVSRKLPADVHLNEMKLQLADTRESLSLGRVKEWTIMELIKRYKAQKKKLGNVVDDEEPSVSEVSVHSQNSQTGLQMITDAEAQFIQGIVKPACTVIVGLPDREWQQHATAAPLPATKTATGNITQNWDACLAQSHPPSFEEKLKCLLSDCMRRMGMDGNSKEYQTDLELKEALDEIKDIHDEAKYSMDRDQLLLIRKDVVRESLYNDMKEALLCEHQFGRTGKIVSVHFAPWLVSNSDARGFAVVQLPCGRSPFPLEALKFRIPNRQWKNL